MDLIRVSKACICAVSVGIAISACGHNAATDSVTTTVDKTTTAEQAVWERFTSDAEAAKKNGDLKKAEGDYKSAIAEAEKLGAQNPAVAKSTANLADFYYVQGDGAQADKLYQRSLALQEKVLGMEHQDLAQSLIGLARVNTSEKKYAAATKYYVRAIAILTKANQDIPNDVLKEYESVKAKNTTEPNPS